MLRTPTIHLNGTSRTALLEAYADASNAIADAQVKLGLTCPNGRDYYLQGPGALAEAQQQHASRWSRLNAVRKELEALMEGIGG